VRASLALSALLALAVACDRPKPIASAPEAAPPVDAAPAVVAAVDAGSPAEAEARAVVAKWSEALDRHDAVPLTAFYADRVKFYGQDLPRELVISNKRRALPATSTFHQEIVGKIALEPTADGFRATFLKRSGPRADLRDVQATLGLARASGSFVIAEETDEVTEKRLAGQRDGRCSTAASKAVAALPEVKREMDEVKKRTLASDGGARQGGVGPLPNDDGSFSMGLGVHTDERFEAIVWYTVGAAGDLTVTVMGADVMVPPAALKAVRDACR
jgi:hypothetical protein